MIDTLPKSGSNDSKGDSFKTMESKGLKDKVDLENLKGEQKKESQFSVTQCIEHNQRLVAKENFDLENSCKNQTIYPKMEHTRINLEVDLEGTSEVVEEIVELDKKQRNTDEMTDVDDDYFDRATELSTCESLPLDSLTCDSVPSTAHGSTSLECSKTLNETTNERILLPTLDVPTRKREKSMTDSTLDRKKKRVKFNPQEDDEGEVLVQTHVFEQVNALDALIRDSDMISNAPLASKLKRLLKQKSKTSAIKDVEIKKLVEIPPIKQKTSSTASVMSETEEEIAFIDDETSDEDTKRLNNSLDVENNEEVLEIGLQDGSGDESDEEKDKEEAGVVSMKREGTFTLDESPPAKAMKPSTSIENISTKTKNDTNNCKVSVDQTDTALADNANVIVKENDIINRNVSQPEILARPILGEMNPKTVVDTSKEIQNEAVIEKEVALEEGNVNFSEDNLKDDTSVRSRSVWSRKAVELKVDSLASKRRAKVNIEKRLNSFDEDKDEEVDNSKMKREKSKSPSFRDSAKKTLINVWKSAMKSSSCNENTAKIPQKTELADRKNATPGKSSDVIDIENPDKNILPNKNYKKYSKVANFQNKIPVISGKSDEQSANLMKGAEPPQSRGIISKPLITKSIRSCNNKGPKCVNGSMEYITDCSSANRKKSVETELDTNIPKNRNPNFNKSASKISTCNKLDPNTGKLPISSDCKNSGLNITNCRTTIVHWKSDARTGIPRPKLEISSFLGSVLHTKSDARSQVKEPKQDKLGPLKETRTNYNKSETRSGSQGPRTDKLGPLVGMVLPFRRDSTFTKCSTRWSRQIDGEKARLEAELRKMSADNERLEGEASQLRRCVDGEEVARKAMRREHLQRTRHIKQEENNKKNLALLDLRNRLEEEQREALSQQKASSNRSTEALLQKQAREHDEQMRRLKQEARHEANRRQSESTGKSSPVCSSSNNNNRETEKLATDLLAIKEDKKKLEETVQRLQESERTHCSDLRQLQREHDVALSNINRTARLEHGNMMDELKSRDRAICGLEKQLAQETLKVQMLQDNSRAKSTEKPADTRKPLTRSNSSPGHQTHKPSSKSTTTTTTTTTTTNKVNKGATGNTTKQQQQQRDDGIKTEVSDSMDAFSRLELTKLREEVEQQRRTIRKLSLITPRESYREDQPMSLGNMASISMDNMFDGVMRPLLQRSRHGDATSKSNTEMLQLITELKDQNKNLKSELQEARDQSDLLEFRILELTEGSDRFSESDEVCSIKEVGTLETPSAGDNHQTSTITNADGSPGNSHAVGQIEDLSLPLSIDSGLDLTADCKKSRNDNISSSCSYPSFKIGATTPANITATNDKNANTTTTIRLNKGMPMKTERVTAALHQKNNSNKEEILSGSRNISSMEVVECSDAAREHEVSSSHAVTEGVGKLESSAKMEEECFESEEVAELAATLQECLASPDKQDRALLHAINRLRCLGNTLTGLHSKVSNLTEENQYLQDALSALGDAHETRTEASGTESEIVNRKTPTLHSDLSDSESDAASSSSRGSLSSSEAPARKTKGINRLDTTSSFQESGIFDAPCDVSNAATQTDAQHESAVVAPEQQQTEDLCSAVARLTSIRSVVQGGGVHMRLHDLQDDRVTGVEGHNNYEHSLEDLLAELSQLKHQLQTVTADKQKLQDNCEKQHKNKPKDSFCRRCYEFTEVEKGESRVLREQLRVAENSRKQLYDDKCELEEAENDARLMVQRLDSQLTAAREMECLLSASLSQEQEISRELHRKVKELQHLEKERSLRQGILERQSMSSIERVASLVMDRDVYASQLAFVKNGLLLLHAYENFRRKNSTATLISYSTNRARGTAAETAAAVSGSCTSAAAGSSLIRILNVSTPRSLSPMEEEEVVEFGDSSSLSSKSGSSCVMMVDCAIDEALLEISDESINCPSSPFLNNSSTNTNNSNRSSTSTTMVYSPSFTLDGIITSTKTSNEFLVTDDFLTSGYSDAGIQTDPVHFFDEATNCIFNNIVVEIDSGFTASKETHANLASVNEDNNRTLSNVTLIQVEASQVPEGASIMVPQKKKKADQRTRSTMTEGEELLSQRERYYLEQIQGLQDEKMSLRKDQEEERLESLQQQQALQAALQQVEQQLADSQKMAASLQCSLEDARQQRDVVSMDMHKRLDEIRGDIARSSELHEIEKKALRRDYDARLSEIGEDRRRYIERLLELEQQLTSLKQELEVVGVAIVTDMTGYEGSPHSASRPGGSITTSAISSSSSNKHVVMTEQTLTSRINTGSELLDKIRQLIKSESALRNKVTELESKESAYRETIQEADQIMSSHVTSYTLRIEELEALNEHCNSRIQLLEKNEDRLRSTLKSGARSEQDCRISELLQQLINTERSELDYKAKLWNHEKNEKQLQIKLMEGEKVQQNLRADLRDEEDMVQKMHALQSENTSLTHQLHQAHDNVRRISEVQQSEQYLRARVEELECTEHCLSESLQQVAVQQASMHRRLTEQILKLEEEVQSCKSQLEAASLRERESHETEQALRRQLETVKLRLQESERDLKVTSFETITYESQHRSEVCKMRAQLKLVNSQLSELEGISCSLRERLAASEQLRDALDKQLEERKRRHESDLLQLNLQASQRENRLEETEGDLCELTQLHAAQELDILASTALAPLIRSLTAVATQIKMCASCSSSNGSNLKELRCQLNTLTDLINGAPLSDTDDNIDDEDTDDEEEAASSLHRSSHTVILADSNSRNENSVNDTNSSVTSSNNKSVITISSSPVQIPNYGGTSTILVTSTSVNTLLLNDNTSSCNGSLSNSLNISRIVEIGGANLSVSPSSLTSTNTSLTSDTNSLSTSDDSSSLKLKAIEESSGGTESPVPVPAPRKKRKQQQQQKLRSEDCVSLRGSFRARKKGNTTILEELEERVRELEESTAKKEEELRIADSEAAELNNRLSATQSLALAKEAEIGEFRRAVVELQQQLVLSIESHEMTKIKLECKYKAGEESMVTRVHRLTLQWERLAERGQLKDHIIATLVLQIRAILRTTNMGVVITQIKQIDEKMERRKQRREVRQQQRLLLCASGQQMPTEEEEDSDGEEQTENFDVQSVCHLLAKPHEVYQV